MKGKIYKWNDQKGFGFIKPDDGSQKLFFHISVVEIGSRRPQIGDRVLFESIFDSEDRVKITSVAIEGAKKGAGSQSETKPIQIEHQKMTPLDYILVLVCLSLLAASGVELYRSGVVENSLLYGIAAVIACMFLSRKRKKDLIG